MFKKHRYRALMSLLLIKWSLTAFDGQRGDLKSQDPSRGSRRGRQREVGTKYQTNTSVFPPDVCFTFPQLNV